MSHLVESQQQKAHVHALHDGPEASHGSTNTHAHETVLCSRTQDTCRQVTPYWFGQGCTVPKDALYNTGRHSAYYVACALLLLQYGWLTWVWLETESCTRCAICYCLGQQSRQQATAVDQPDEAVLLFKSSWCSEYTEHCIVSSCPGSAAGSSAQMTYVAVSAACPSSWTLFELLTANGCVQHTHVTELLVQVVCDLVTATIVTDILT